VLDEIDREVVPVQLEATLMFGGIKKFADPQHGLLTLTGEKRQPLGVA
jgi:hypothetical protein